MIQLIIALIGMGRVKGQGLSPPVANTPKRKFGLLPFRQTQWAAPLHNNDSILE